MESDMFGFRIVIKGQPLTRRGTGYSRSLPVSQEENFAGFVLNDARLGRQDLRRVPAYVGKSGEASRLHLSVSLWNDV